MLTRHGKSHAQGQAAEQLFFASHVCPAATLLQHVMPANTQFGVKQEPQKEKAKSGNHKCQGILKRDSQG